MIFVFINRCQEVPDLELGDDTVKVFLNTKGTVGTVSRDLRELLEYIETSKIPAGCRNSLIPELETELDAARNNKEWERDYMTLEMLKHDSREEGIEIGREEGIEIGDKKRQNSVILNMLHRGLPEDLIAEVAEISIEEIRKIKEAM